MRKPKGHARLCRRPQSPSAQLLSPHSGSTQGLHPTSVGPEAAHSLVLYPASFSEPGSMAQGFWGCSQRGPFLWFLCCSCLFSLAGQDCWRCARHRAQLPNVSDSPNQSWVTFSSKIPISDGFGCTFLSLAFCLRSRPTVSSSDTAPAWRDNLTPALLPVPVTAGDLELSLPSPPVPSPPIDSLAALHQLPTRKSWALCGGTHSGVL